MNPGGRIGFGPCPSPLTSNFWFCEPGDIIISFANGIWDERAIAVCCGDRNAIMGDSICAKHRNAACGSAP
jgi:hypothetical protein